MRDRPRCAGSASGRAGSARRARGCRSRLRSEVELGDVAQHGVDLTEHLPALVLEPAVVAAQAVVVLAQARHGLGGATHPGLELRQPGRDGVGPGPLLSPPPNAGAPPPPLPWASPPPPPAARAPQPH